MGWGCRWLDCRGGGHKIGCLNPKRKYILYSKSGFLILTIEYYEAFYNAYKNDVILAYHLSIKMYSGLQLVIYPVYWPFVLYDVIFVIGTVNIFNY